MSMSNKMRIILMAAVLFLAALTAFILSPVTAQTNPETGQEDAIGIRIIPNPNHYSVMRWYESQGFTGAPQPLKVDGYEALRDGRTVYVNVANVVKETNKLYTNIYLISYNQEPQAKTTDILAQIIARWQFNDNLPPEPATCSISAFKCEQDSDCTNLQTCEAATNSCVLKEPKNCLVDDDCPVNFFCDSTKAGVIRDINRVGKIEELREALAKYRQTNGRFPLLSAGTYLPGKTLSVWPSWNENFLPAIGLRSGFLDPINRLGACPGYDAKTCWNANTTSFFGVLSASLPPDEYTFKLPNNSYAIAYGTNSTGSNYDLCTVLESPFNFEPGHGTGNCLTDSIVATGMAGNKEPSITNINLNGIAGREYNGFVRAIDPDGDPLIWELDISEGDWSGWSSTPILQGTSDPNQKRIFANQAGGAPGNQEITIKVSDNKGASTSTTTKIILSPSSSFAETSEYTYRLSLSNPFSYSFYISGEGGAPSYSLSRINGPAILEFFTPFIINEGINRKKITYQGIVPTSTSFLEDSTTNYRLTVNSPNGTTAVTNFTIYVKVEKPILNFNCATQVRFDHDYECLIGLEKQGDFTIEYSTSPLPPGLELNQELGRGAFYINGRATTPDLGRIITIEAINDYGTKNIKSFNLQVNTYCGDGQRDYPNTEGRGGIYNNGLESCDGNSGVAFSANSSSKFAQYACNTLPNSKTPYPINNNSYCVFKSPIDGGGYCGDTFCNVQHEKNCDLECCRFDCDPLYFQPNPGGEIGPGIPGDDECEVTADCPDYHTCETGVCVIPCWNVTETVNAIVFRMGDATVVNKNYEYWVNNWNGYKSVKFNNLQLTGCSDNQANNNICTYNHGSTFTGLGCTYVKIDDPKCGQSVACPPGCNVGPVYVGKTGDGDSCRQATWNWQSRDRYRCSRTALVQRCAGEPCRATPGDVGLNGTMSVNGSCIKNPVTPPPNASHCYNDEECQNILGPNFTCIGLTEYCGETTGITGSPCAAFPNYQSCMANFPDCDWFTIPGVCSDMLQ